MKPAEVRRQIAEDRERRRTRHFVRRRGNRFAALPVSVDFIIDGVRYVASTWGSAT